MCTLKPVVFNPHCDHIDFEQLFVSSLAAQSCIKSPGTERLGSPVCNTPFCREFQGNNSGSCLVFYYWLTAVGWAMLGSGHWQMQIAFVLAVISVNAPITCLGTDGIWVLSIGDCIHFLAYWNRTMYRLENISLYGSPCFPLVCYEMWC